MRAPILAGVVGLISVALAPPAAIADTCGSDPATSAASASAASSSDSAPACEEVSSVVGETVCSRYGSWDARRRPRLRLTVGTSMVRRSIAGLQMDGAASHPESAASFRVATRAGSPAAFGGTLDVALTTALGRHLYLGVEGHVGALESSEFRSDSDSDALNTATSGATLLAAAAVAGAAVEVGSFRLRGELAVGVEAIGVTVETAAGDCEASSALFSTRAAALGRVGLERWLTPWITAGVVVGRDLGGESSSLGLMLGGHLRAFDGSR